jgi:Uma2 family endonuclease
MSTIDEPRKRTLPPLIAGQRLDQPSFHDRYEAMPPETRAELVGGVVFMPSPMRRDHGMEGHIVGGWLFHYQLKTPGVKGADGATVILDQQGEPQPDCQLFIAPEWGGQIRFDPNGYFAGAPELIIEVARSSRSFDLGVKKADYERAGVQEYVVVVLDPDQIHWFIRRDDRFEDLPPGPDGVYRSEIFPGLWLDPSALYAEDLDRLIEVLDQGLATPAHTAFVARLGKARRGTSEPA